MLTHLVFVCLALSMPHSIEFQIPALAMQDISGILKANPVCNAIVHARPVMEPLTSALPVLLTGFYPTTHADVSMENTGRQVV